jgi:hypothetical protein
MTATTPHAEATSWYDQPANPWNVARALRYAVGGLGTADIMPVWQLDGIFEPAADLHARLLIYPHTGAGPEIIAWLDAHSLPYRRSSAGPLIVNAQAAYICLAALPV